MINNCKKIIKLYFIFTMLLFILSCTNNENKNLISEKILYDTLKLNKDGIILLKADSSWFNIDFIDKNYNMSKFHDKYFEYDLFYETKYYFTKNYIFENSFEELITKKNSKNAMVIINNQRKCFYIFWENENNKTLLNNSNDSNGINKPYLLELFFIGKNTKYILTNLSLVTIKNLFPQFCGDFESGKIISIKADFLNYYITETHYYDFYEEKTIFFNEFRFFDQIEFKGYGE